MDRHLPSSRLCYRASFRLNDENVAHFGYNLYAKLNIVERGSNPYQKVNTKQDIAKIFTRSFPNDQAITDRANHQSYKEKAPLKDLQNAFKVVKQSKIEMDSWIPKENTVLTEIDPKEQKED